MAEIGIEYKGERKLFYLTIPGDDHKNITRELGYAGISLLKYMIDEEAPVLPKTNWQNIQLESKTALHYVVSGY